MGTIKVIELASVRHEEICVALDGMGLRWEDVCHVTATTSLAQTIARHTTRPCVAIWIAGLTDLITSPGRPGEYQYPITGFPGPSVLEDAGWAAYREAANLWSSGLSGRHINLTVRMNDVLRDWAYGDSSNREMGRMLVKSRRGFAQTLQTLISSGAKPDQVGKTSPEAVKAAEAWATIERELPALTSLRDDLWVKPEDFIKGLTEHARDLRARIEAALTAVFGEASGKRTIVYHGFYFYTPPQWALFQLFQAMPDVNQIFVIHDDGESPVFEIWRNFFHPSWRMPWPDRIPTREGVTLPADALRRALSGEQIDAETLSESLRLVEYPSPSEFVGHCRQELALASNEGEEQPTLFAADSRTISRYFRRLGSASTAVRADLAQLPIGAFLLALHDCLTPNQGGAGVRIEMTIEALIDIVGSGFLQVGGGQIIGPESVALLRRTAPFFRRCVTTDEWTGRAQSLHWLIRDRVTPLGASDPAQSDEVRLRVASKNPLRLAPWADLSVQQAQRVESIVTGVAELLTALADQERIRIEDHLGFLRRELERGMRELPPALQNEIRARVDGFSVELDGDIDVQGIVDVVRMLLGQQPEIETVFDEDEEEVVGSLRNLDALGMTRGARDIHLANLADGAFPARAADFGWPFTLTDISFMPISREILQARIDLAPLADLYLVWLALDGMEPGKKVILSWISDVAGEPRNRSSVLGLLAVPESRSDAVKQRTGGLTVQPAPSLGGEEARYSVPEPLPSEAADDAFVDIEERLSPRTLASVLMCPRRFALQWGMGPSAAYMQAYQQSILYGNASVALTKWRLMPSVRTAEEVCRLLWSGMSEAEISSSHTNRRDLSYPEWILTLGGAGNRNDSQSMAYQAARGMVTIPLNVITEVRDRLLPERGDATVGQTAMPENCKRCPVKPRCAVWADSRDVT